MALCAEQYATQIGGMSAWFTIDSMRGKPKVLSLLNEALKEELEAINQYFLHAEMCENWHYHKLGDFHQEAVDR